MSHRSSSRPEPEVPALFTAAVIGVIALVLAAILFFTFTVRVDAGQACAKLTFGKATGQAGPGLHARVPGVTKYRCFTGTVQTLDVLMTADVSQMNSNATYKDVYIEGKTNTGVNYAVSLSLSYTTPVDNVRTIYQTVGKSDAAVFQKGVNNPLRVVTRQVLNTHSADELYYGNLESLSNEVRAKLEIEMQKYGITLQFFGIKAFDFDDAYEQRISAKNAEIENAKLVDLQAETASKEAERKRVEAEGNKAKAIIEAEARAAQVIIDANAAAEEVRISAQASADSRVIVSEATAIDYENRGIALAAYPEILEMERIQAIRSANVIYLPSDTGILPILDVSAKDATE